MTEEELLAIAEKLASQQIVVENYGIMNTPSDVEQRVKMDARYMVARDKLRQLRWDYETALRQFISEGK